MIPTRLTADDRAVSTTVTYVLTMAITAVLLGGLITAAGGLVENQRTQAVRNELGVVGERMAGELTSVDVLVQAGDDPAVRLRARHPEQVAGRYYAVELVTGGTPPCSAQQCLVLSTDDVTVTVPFATATPVQPGRMSGGTVVIEYDAVNGTLGVTKP
ncbi:hypothetical protein V5735_01700 (plasmid) [Haladaptatus sp. SPP-AMP-3]|uniref:DUF7266 family protein n=1 Tax=Haladaptatus sp. SPP-AMP-3 TaxID=3121295 RepID=UPI003C2E8ACF